MRRRQVLAPPAVLAATALAAAAGRVLPASAGLLATAAAAVWLPGLALLLATGLAARLGAVGAAAAAVPAGLVVWAPPLLVALAAGLPFAAALGAVIVAAAALMAVPAERPAPPGRTEAAGLAAAAVAAAVLADRLRSPLASDALFHAGRIRKLLDLPDLSFGGVSAYRGGEPHAGYVVPLLHAAEAGAVRLADLDPSAAYPHLAAAAAVVLVLAAYAAGRAVGGPPVGAAALLLAGWDAAERGDRPLGFLQQPAAFTFHVLMPALVLALVEHHRHPRDGRRAAAVVAVVAVVALVHPTYAVAAVAMVLGAALVTRRGLVPAAAAAGLVAAVFAAIWLVALRGGEPRTGRTTAEGGYARVGDLALTASDRLLVGGRAAVALAAAGVLVLLWRGRGLPALPAWLAAAALVPAASPGAVALVAEAIGAGQARRLAHAVPWAVAGAAAAGVVADRLGRRWPAAALAAAAASSVLAAATGAWDGDVSVALAVAVAVSGLAALLVRLARRRPLAVAGESWHATAAAALVGAAALAGPLVADGPEIGREARDGPASAAAERRVGPGLVAFMRAHDDAPFPVVLARPRAGPRDGYTGIAFQLVGLADVYAAALPESRTRAEPRNDPAERRRLADRVYAAATTPAQRAAILDRLGVDYVIADAGRSPATARRLRADPGLRQAYADPPGSPNRLVVFARR